MTRVLNLGPYILRHSLNKIFGAQESGPVKTGPTGPVATSLHSCVRGIVVSYIFKLAKQASKQPAPMYIHVG